MFIVLKLHQLLHIYICSKTQAWQHQHHAFSSARTNKLDRVDGKIEGAMVILPAGQ